MRKFLGIILVGASLVFGAADTVVNLDFERVPNSELAISCIVSDVVNDSVGDTLRLYMYGRNRTAAGTKTGVCSTYTSWQKCYFNCVASPDFPSPADYPEVDSVVVIVPADSTWYFLPSISTPLFHQMRIQFIMEQGNNRTSSAGTNTRFLGEVLQRREGASPHRVANWILDTLVAP